MSSPISFVRLLRGAPASVLWAFIFARRPMTNLELQRWTGYSEDTISIAIRTLVDLGWAVALSPRGPWGLSPAHQLILAGPPSPEIPGSDPEISGSDPKLSGSFLSSSSLILESPSSVKEEEEEKKPKNPGTPRPDDNEDPRFVAALHALYDAGIREPTAGRLARLPHVTPEYVAAHVEQSNLQGLRLGTAIYRIEHAWPQPDRRSIKTVDDQIRKFLGDEQ